MAWIRHQHAVKGSCGLFGVTLAEVVIIEQVMTCSFNLDCGQISCEVFPSLIENRISAPKGNYKSKKISSSTTNWTYGE